MYYTYTLNILNFFWDLYIYYSPRLGATQRTTCQTNFYSQVPASFAIRAQRTSQRPGCWVVMGTHNHNHASASNKMGQRDKKKSWNTFIYIYSFFAAAQWQRRQHYREGTQTTMKCTNWLFAGYAQTIYANKMFSWGSIYIFLPSVPEVRTNPFGPSRHFEHPAKYCVNKRESIRSMQIYSKHIWNWP